MLSILLNHEGVASEIPKEGDLYKEIIISGKTFRILYGYYEEFEREGKYNDPMPVYPDLKVNPVYTDDGRPFATAIQDVCSRYKGKENGDGDSCSDCLHFKLCEDLIGICDCSQLRTQKEKQADVQRE